MSIEIKSTNLTPVRYPGGKSRALRFLHPLLMEKSYSEYREPFIGGGSVALYLMQYNKDAAYWLNDLFYPVYCFWEVLYTKPQKMVKFIHSNRNSYLVENDIRGRLVDGKKIPSKSAENGRNLYKFCRDEIKKSIIDKNEFETACYWFILNKLSFSGLSMIGSYSPLAFDQNFSQKSVERLLKVSKLMHQVKSLKITNLDYSEVLKNSNEKTLLYADPPYDIKDFIYGNDGDMHRGFDHKKFKEDISNCKANWIISYNDNPNIVKMFDGYRQEKFNLTYTMNVTQKNGVNDSNSGKSAKQGKELIVLNY